MAEHIKQYPCGETSCREFADAVRYSIRRADQHYEHLTGKISNETLREAANSHAAKAVVGMLGATAAVGGAMVMSAGFNDGTPMAVGFGGAVAGIGYSLHHIKNTKMVKGLVAGARKLHQETAPGRQKISQKIKGFSRKAQLKLGETSLKMMESNNPTKKKVGKVLGKVFLASRGR